MTNVAQETHAQKVFGRKKASKLLRDIGLALELFHARKRAKLTQRNGRWYVVLELPRNAKADEQQLPEDITTKADAKLLAADITVDLWNSYAAAIAKAGAK